MVGLFTGTNSELQLEAGWCITNISAGTHNHAMSITKYVAPYLVAYLSSDNYLLQVNIHLRDCVVFLALREFVQVFFFICLYRFCRWRSNYQEEGVEIPLTGLNPPHFCACPKLGLGFRTPYIILCSVV